MFCTLAVLLEGYCWKQLVSYYFKKIKDDCLIKYSPLLFYSLDVCLVQKERSNYIYLKSSSYSRTRKLPLVLWLKTTFSDIDLWRDIGHIDKYSLLIFYFLFLFFRCLFWEYVHSMNYAYSQLSCYSSEFLCFQFRW